MFTCKKKIFRKKLIKLFDRKESWYFFRIPDVTQKGD